MNYFNDRIRTPRNYKNFFWLFPVFILLFACKGSKTEIGSKPENVVNAKGESVEISSEKLKKLIAERNVNRKKDSLALVQQGTAIKNFIASKKGTSKTKGITVIEEKDWTKTFSDYTKGAAIVDQYDEFIQYIKDYIENKAIFEKKYPVAQLGKFRKDNLYYRFFAGDSLALPKMISIIQTRDVDSIIDLYADLDQLDYFEKYDDGKLFKNEKLVRLIIQDFGDGNFERVTAPIVVKVKKPDGVKIVEERLKSGQSSFEEYLIESLAKEGTSLVGLNYIEKALAEKDFNGYNIRKLLKLYLKNAKNEEIRNSAVTIGFEFFLNKYDYLEGKLTKLKAARSDFRISHRSYKYHSRLEGLILFYAGKKHIPYLLKLNTPQKTGIIDYKLWELGYDIPDETVVEFLSDKSMMRFMLNSDMQEKSLLKDIDGIYEIVFDEEILHAIKYNNTLYSWRDVIYYFKDENRESFKNELRNALQNENNYSQERLNIIFDAFLIANQSKIDILNFLKETHFVDEATYRKSLEKIKDTSENKNPNLLTNLYSVLKLSNNHFTIVNGYKDVQKTIEEHGNRMFENMKFSAIPKTDIEKNDRNDDEIPELILGLYKNKAYAMNLQEYDPKPYLDCDNSLGKYIRFINYIFEDNNVKKRINPYTSIYNCDGFWSLIGTKENVDKIINRYKYVLLLSSYL